MEQFDAKRVDAVLAGKKVAITDVEKHAVKLRDQAAARGCTFKQVKSDSSKFIMFLMESADGSVREYTHISVGSPRKPRGTVLRQLNVRFL